MKFKSLTLGVSLLSAATVAVAGQTVVLGTPLGAAMSSAVTALVGHSVDIGPTLGNGVMLSVAAAALGLGAFIVRRKRRS